jgi:hypothetical protein
MVGCSEKQATAAEAKCKNPTKSLHDENSVLLVSSVVMRARCAGVVAALVGRAAHIIRTAVRCCVFAATVVGPARSASRGRASIGAGSGCPGGSVGVASGPGVARGPRWGCDQKDSEQEGAYTAEECHSRTPRLRKQLCTTLYT